MDVQKFTGAVVSIVVVVIIAVTVLIPIITTNQVVSTEENPVANAASINAMLNIIPLLVIVGIIIAVVGMFLYTRRN